MGVIERLRRLDDRLGLDSPDRRREREERRAALDALPDAMRRSLARRRVVAIAVIIATLVAVGLLVLTVLRPDHDGWAMATVVLTFIGTLVGALVGRRIERNVLVEHAARCTPGPWPR